MISSIFYVCIFTAIDLLKKKVVLLTKLSAAIRLLNAYNKTGRVDIGAAQSAAPTELIRGSSPPPPYGRKITAKS